MKKLFFFLLAITLTVTVFAQATTWDSAPCGTTGIIKKKVYRPTTDEYRKSIIVNPNVNVDVVSQKDTVLNNNINNIYVPKTENHHGFDLIAVISIIALIVLALFAYFHSDNKKMNMTQQLNASRDKNPWNNQTAQVLSPGGGWGSYTSPDGTKVLICVNSPNDQTNEVTKSLYTAPGLKPLP